jgi:hypothetical protein
VGLFFFVILFFWLCASAISLGQCVVVETKCNWYLRGINIYSLLKKNKSVAAIKNVAKKYKAKL